LHTFNFGIEKALDMSLEFKKMWAASERSCIK
jgi:hypothetical protein